MKRTYILPLCAVAMTACFSPTIVRAQDAGGAPQQHRMTIDERLARMKDALSLSDDQVTKLKAIFEDQKAQLDPIWKDTSLSREQKREKSKPIMESGKAKVNAVLTPEQQAKLKELRKEHKMGHHGEAAGSPASGQ
ncbi:MAG TPA: hypothetical protein VIM48_00100 [Chthoniobacterales bacterium]